VLWLAAILVAWCFLIAGRLVKLQIVDYGDFTQRAARQQRRTIDVSPRRGVIYDRNGHELAMTISVDSVFAVPSDMPDPAMAAGLLGRVLGVPSKEMLAKLDTSKNFVWVARKLDAAQVERIRSLNLKGIYPKRDEALLSEA
jgi:cell division protein FtsI (penicillin-binding protein 3)